jgi:lipoprotein-releasing system ATP-binding protein
MQFNDAGRVVQLFDNLNFKVASGGSMAIMGQSGVGKTTLLYLLGGLEEPVSGEVFIGGQSYQEVRKSGADVAMFRGSRVGFVFQFHNLLAEFDAVENVAFPLLIRGENHKEAVDVAKSLLVRVGLEHRFDHRPGALSGGEQQRVAVARAIAGRPGVILADEPTGNLDQRTGAEVKDLLLELQTEKRITLILVTHSPELAESMDRVTELTPQGMRDRVNKESSR